MLTRWERVYSVGMKVLAVLSVVLASMVVRCSLAADVTPAPAEEIAMTMVAATAEVESTVSVALDETQPATDVPTQPAGWCTGCVVQCLRISISLTPSGLRLHAITEKIEYSPELNDWGIT